MIQLKSISFNRLLKLEVPQFTNSVIRIVERHNPETLKIDAIFDLLEMQKPQLDFLEVRYGAHPLTREIDSLCKKRTDYAVSITNKMRSISSADMEDERENAKVILPVVNRFLISLGINDRDVVTEIVSQLFMRIDEDETLESAFTALGFSTYLDALRSVNSTLIEILDQRMVLLSERPQENTLMILKNLNVAVRNLFTEIKLARLRNIELDYTNLIQELNIILTTYGQKINKRKGINKKKAEGSVLDAASNESTEFTPRIVSLGVINEDNLDNVDKKKTVALSTTTKQLPTSSTEA